MQRLFSLFFALFFLSLSHAGGLSNDEPEEAGRYQPRYYPFADGERVLYQASWNGIPIAKAKIHTSLVWRGGKKFYQVKVRARTFKYLDPFWKMRDSIESIFEADTLRPHRYTFRQRENRKRIDTTALYDHESKKWVVRRQKRHKVRQFEFMSRNTLDPISATYFVRSIDFEVGDRIQLEVFGGKSRYLVILDVVGEERIRVKAGLFNAYKIIPRVINLSRSGYARRVRQVTVWMSADQKRRPLRIISDVFIGSVYIEMVDEMA